MRKYTDTRNEKTNWYEKEWLVIFLCFFFFPVGLYGLWKSEGFSQGIKLIITIGLGFFLYCVLSNKTKSTDAPGTKQIGTDAQERSYQNGENGSREPHLFLSVDDFKEAFNRYCTSNDIDMVIYDIEVQHGEVYNTFQCMFSKNLGLVGTVNKSDASLRELLMVGSGNGTIESGAEILLCMASIIATVDPALKPSERGQIIKKLGMLGDRDRDILNMSHKTKRNGITYTVNSSHMTGIIFSVSTLDP